MQGDGRAEATITQGYYIRGFLEVISPSNKIKMFLVCFFVVASQLEDH